MSSQSRRQFLSGSTTIPFAVWVERQALAQTPVARPDEASQQGQEMLKIHADAVRIMMQAPQEDPTAFLTKEFVFADENGSRVAIKLQDFLSIDALGYSYDFPNLPSTAKSKTASRPYPVGTIHFYDAVGHGDHGIGAAASQKFDSFDITVLSTKLQAAERLHGKPSVTIAPFGRAPADAKPGIREIHLVEQ